MVKSHICLFIMETSEPVNMKVWRGLSSCIRQAYDIKRILDSILIQHLRNEMKTQKLVLTVPGDTITAPGPFSSLLNCHLCQTEFGSICSETFVVILASKSVVLHNFLALRTELVREVRFKAILCCLYATNTTLHYFTFCCVNHEVQ